MTHNESGDGRSTAISLGDEDRVNEVLASAVVGLWEVVNSLTRLKPSRRERYRVTIFGSARVSRERSGMRRPGGSQKRSHRWAAM
jgi:hypothetical protein